MRYTNPRLLYFTLLLYSFEFVTCIGMCITEVKTEHGTLLVEYRET